MFNLFPLGQNKLRQDTVAVAPYEWILRVLLLACAYFVTGKLGTFLAIPPGYATAVWPPSGIALACILICGYRYWPGILLGSFAVNFSIALVTGSPFDVVVSVIIALIISGGASLQAVAGAWLVRRFAGFPNLLSLEKDVFLFFFYGGLIGSLVNSTISVSTLVLIGRIPLSNFLVNWGTWWLGDTLGVLIFTPLVLAWGMRPAEHWLGRRLVITLPIIGLFLLTTAAVFYESKQESEKLKSGFDEHSLELKATLEKSISTYISVLRSLDSFYISSTNVDRKKFQSFVANSLENFQGIQALEWSPVIQASNREAFEKSIKQEGYPDFQIVERNQEQKTVRASERPNYIPVTFVEPFVGNEKALGYDLYSNPVRQAAINRARDTGEITATAPITLIQEKGHQHGVLAFMPIYRKEISPQTLEERRNSISGYVLAVFRGKDIVTTALKELNLDGLTYQVLDKQAPEGEQLLFTSDQKDLKPLVLREHGLFGRDFSLLSSHVISVGGRQWSFDIAPTQNYFVSHHSNNALWMSLAGLILTSLAGAFVMISSGRGSLLRRLVEERTAALTLSEERFRSTFERAPIGVTNLSLDGRFLDVNQGYCDLVGYSREELLNMNFKQVTHPDYQQIDTELIGQVLDGQISGFTVEKQYIRKNGEIIWCNLSVTLIRNHEGLPDHFIDVVENIDRRKTAEESLTKLSLAVEQSPSSVLITDLNGNIEYVNESFVKTTGYHREEVIGKNPRMLQSGKTDKSIYDDMWDILTQGEVWKGELTNKRKNGEEYTEAALISPVRQANGKITHYLGIKEDISERKQHEAATLLAKEQAEALAQSKSEFLANMSHEIRTPMNAIVGLSHLALTKTSLNELRDYLEKINRASEGLLDILNDILDFSKIEAGKLGIETINFNLHDVVDHLCSLFSTQAAEKQLDLRIEIADNVPVNLVGDALRIQQVLSNLLGNAIKFTECGHICIQVSVQETHTSQVKLRFSVTDTGIGISSEDQVKLFQPFSQADTSITRRFGGTGLGLVICQRLLQLMNSKFHLQSTQGQGSTFYFDLLLGLASLEQSHFPHRRHTEHSPGIFLPELREHGALLKGCRILVAEDNRINQQVTKEYLEYFDIQVDIANNGLEVIQLLNQKPYDIILMDVHMPEMGGVEATEHIRRQPAFFSLPIIALTAGVTQAERQKCLGSGMNDFVAKPIHPEQLIRVLCHWVKGQTTNTYENRPIVVDAVAHQNYDFGHNVQWLELAQKLPEFDLHDAMVIFGEQPEHLLKLLADFSVDFNNVAEEITKLLEQGDLWSAEKLLHTLKGVAGNLGAKTLHKASEVLEQQVKQGAFNDQSLQKWNHALDCTMTDIASLLREPIMSSATDTLNAEKLGQLFSELDYLLANDDFVDDSLLGRIERALSTEQRALFHTLSKYIYATNNQAARSVLDALRGVNAAQ